ncbi:hypothetical protein ACH4VM_22200, partial [Streptomyces sp. NPDC020792]
MISRAATPRTPPAGRECWGRTHHAGRPIGRYPGPATAATAVSGAGRVWSVVGPAVAAVCAGLSVAATA